MADKHVIVDSWRDAVVQCSCGWQGAEKTLKAAMAAWRQHKQRHAIDKNT